MNGIDSPLEAHDIGVTLGGVRVLDAVSIALPAGHWTAIIGPNGAGKSTLLSVLAGLRRPDCGQVSVGGDRIETLATRERARRIAWLAQQGEADGELPARAIVALGRLPHLGLLGTPGADDQRAVDLALEATGATAFAARRLGELSGGERQRVLLARVLAVQAPVVLLDEPTTHLDAPHQRAVLCCITGLVRQRTAVAAVLHDLTLALAADTVVVMDRGRVRATGSPGDPALHATIEDVFERAVSIERIERRRREGDGSDGDGSDRGGSDGNEGGRGGTRWVAVPSP